MQRTTLFTCTALAATLATGCALPRAIDADARDTDGTFDGDWRVDVLPAANKTQEKPGWRLNCEGMEHSFVVSVDDGTMRASTGPGEMHEAYVSDDGRFTLAMPVGGQASEKAGSTVILGLGDTTLFLSGDLDDEQPSGTFMVGIKEFGNSGCRTRARLVRA